MKQLSNVKLTVPVPVLLDMVEKRAQIVQLSITKWMGSVQVPKQRAKAIVLWLVSFLQNVHVESLEQSYVKAMAHVYANLCTMVLIATNVRKAILKMKVVFAA